MKVDLRELKKAQDYLREINKADLRSIEWCMGEIPIKVSEEDLQEFSYMGLSNREFPSIFLKG